MGSRTSFFEFNILISVTSTERESPHNASSEKNSEWDADGDEYSKESEQSFFGPSFIIASIDSGSFGVCDNTAHGGVDIRYVESLNLARIYCWSKGLGSRVGS